LGWLTASDLSRNAADAELRLRLNSSLGNEAGGGILGSHSREVRAIDSVIAGVSAKSLETCLSLFSPEIASGLQYQLGVLVVEAVIRANCPAVWN